MDSDITKTSAMATEVHEHGAEDFGETMQTVTVLHAAQQKLSERPSRGARETRPEQPDPGRYERGSTIGRYMVLELLGRGGMGVVYLAYDPELDRRVAIKVLRTRASSKVRQRLEREARALARLSHPNVVQVYDAGVHEGHLFMAMELIEGSALDEWCRTDPAPGWRAVLDVYVQVARGIAAAHGKGMVHRDIKPANLLLGNDGRVCVADFGLAAARDFRSAPSSDGIPDNILDSAQDSGAHSGPHSGLHSIESSVDGLPSVSSQGSLRARLEDSMTRTGTLMGTPAFMAPEQQAAGECSPATDQYSFCASLYSSLYGVLPFTVANVRKQLNKLLRLKKRVEVNPPEGDTEVPGWVHDIVMRGLAPEPDGRYPSMNELLGALEDDPLVRRRVVMRRIGWAGLGVVFIALLVALWSQRQQSSEPCVGVPRALDGIWDDRVEERVRSAFLATELAYAKSTADRVATVLDGYAAEWRTMAVASCRATRVHQVQSETVMAVRDYCLERRRRQLQALTRLYGEGPDKQVLQNAVQAAQTLPAIDYCSDVLALTAAVPPPEEPVLRAQVAALERRVDTLESSRRAGKSKTVLGESVALLADTSIVDFPPLQARTLFVVGLVHMDVAKYSEAEDYLRRALPLAARAKDDRLLAGAWNQLWFVIGQRQARVGEALLLKDAVFTAAERSGDVATLAAAHGYLASLHGVAGKYDLAGESFRRALDMRERALGPDHELMAMDVSNLASNHLRLGAFDKALRGSERALAIGAANLGAGHPVIAAYLTNLANAQSALGRYESAVSSHERAMVVTENSMGPEHPDLASNLNNLADLFAKIGRYQDAQNRAERALAIWTARLGPEHPYVGVALVNLGGVARANGDHEKARQHLARAEGIMRTAFGGEHPFVAHVLAGQGRVSVAAGELSQAKEQIVAALAMMETTMGADHPDLIEPLLGLGELGIARAVPVTAIPHLERALGLASANPSARAHIQFALARAQWLLGGSGRASDGERRQAVELARKARETFQQIGHRNKLAEVVAWLAEIDAGNTDRPE